MKVTGRRFDLSESYSYQPPPGNVLLRDKAFIARNENLGAVFVPAICSNSSFVRPVPPVQEGLSRQGPSTSVTLPHSLNIRSANAAVPADDRHAKI